jgi:hypothetical protein
MLSDLVIPKCWSIWTILARLESPRRALSEGVLHLFSLISYEAINVE